MFDAERLSGDEFDNRESALKMSSALKALIDLESDGLNQSTREGAARFDEIFGDNWTSTLLPALEGILYTNLYPHYDAEGDDTLQKVISLNLVFAGFQLGGHKSFPVVLPELVSRVFESGIVDENTSHAQVGRYVITCFVIGLNYRDYDSTIGSESFTGPFADYIKGLDLSDI